MSYASGFAGARTKLLDYSKMHRLIRDRINPEEVLEHYGAQNLYQDGDELIHSCLIDRVHPHHTNGDQDPSAALNVDKLQYSCYSYGGGSLVWLIQELEDCTEHEALDILAKFLSEDSERPKRTLMETLRKIFDSEESAQPMPTFSTILLRPWRMIHPYMTETRGFDQKTLERYNVGYDEDEVKITLPHFWKGKLVGYQKRRLDHPDWPMSDTFDYKGRKVPKYKNSKGFPKDSTFYNYDTVKERRQNHVVVVESIMSVLMAETWHDQGNEGFDNFLASFGGKVTQTNIDILKEFESVTLFLDNDPGGWGGTVKLYNGLKGFVKVYIVVPPENMDLADMSLEQAKEVLSKKRLGALAIKTVVDKIGKVKQWDSKSTQR